MIFMMLSRHEFDSQRNFAYSVNNEENAPQISKIEETKDSLAASERWQIRPNHYTADCCRNSRGMLDVRDDPIFPAGGGGWDKQKKRMRSSGAASNRSITLKKIVKHAVHVKLSAETMLQPPQA